MRRSTHKSLIVLQLMFILMMSCSDRLQALCIGVGCTCSVSSSGLNFGNYDPTSLSALLMNGDIIVSCTAAAVNARIGYTVNLSTGLSNTYNLRTMSNGNSLLKYNIFVDSGHTQIAGNGTSATTAIADNYLITQILTPYSISYPVFGMIFPSQNVIKGSYTDLVVLTVNF